jgi:glutamine amidotransferase
MGAVVLVDSGGCNIGSLRHALQRLGVDARLTANGQDIRAAAHVILPGVGAAAAAMRQLRETGLIEVLRGLRQPVLGICLGMQLLFAHSEEGDTDCLSLIPGRVRKMARSARVRVPHMGWNALRNVRPHRLLAGINDGDYAYFVHGFAAPVADTTLAACAHGEEFAAIVQQDNFFGAQFHPERSAGVGARLLHNFLEL